MVDGEMKGQAIKRPGCLLSLWPQFTVLVWVGHSTFLTLCFEFQNERIKPEVVSEVPFSSVVY